MRNKTLGRASSRIAAIAALSVMAVGGLASAASASPPDETYCETDSLVAFDCLNEPFTAFAPHYGPENLGTWAETRYGGSIDNAGHNCTRYVAFRLADNGLADTGTWGNGGNWPNHFAEGAGKNTTPAVGSVASWPGKNHVGYVDRVEHIGGVTWVFVTEDSISGWTKASWYSSADPANYPTWFLHPYDLVVADEAPAIHGLPKVDEELEVIPGDWGTVPASVTYEWFNGATSVGTGPTYRLQQTDIGGSIKVVETVTIAGRGTQPAESYTLAVFADEFEGMAIANVLGVPHVGNILSADLDTAMTGIVPEYQWMHGNAEIGGATQQAYTVPASDISLPLRVAITLTRPGYADKTILSGYTAAVEPAGVVMSAVTVTGTPQVDQTLTANVTVTTAGATVLYQWFRDGFPISGAQGPTYRLTASDVGASITVTVTGSKTTYDTTYRTSGQVTAGLASIAMSGVSIGSTARVGVTLYSNLSVTTPGASVAYYWYRNGTTLVGTGSYYTPSIYDNGAVISLNVAVSKAGYATAYRNSAGVSVAPALMGTFYATIQGTNRVEYTLSAAVTSATPGVALTYYWKRGSTVVSTGTYYTLQPADIGQSITLTVVGTKAGYATSTTVAGAGTTAGYLSYSFSGAPAAISGTAKVGRVLTAITALQTSGVTITYRWYKNGTPISATGRTYTLKSTDKGARMTVRIYFDKLGHQATSSLSTATATVVA